MMLPATSVIIPTFHEADNLPQLTQEIAQLTSKFSELEVIIVDDNSQDNTKEIIDTLQKKYHWLRFIQRQTKPDLSQAVITGMQQAAHDILVTMDADLSHTPEDILKLVKALEQEHADFVLGSRFTAGGGTAENWPYFRRINAYIAKGLAKHLTRSHDPLSGFFCLRRKTFLEAKNLNPIGYKIGLELMVKCHCQKIIEIPILFQQRHKGKSKLNWQQQFYYLRHIGRLTWYCIKNRK